MERIIFRNEQGLGIEAIYNKGRSNRGVVVAHPHPLYGGDMANPVVESVAAVYERKGFATLRPNFRGVGRSEGQFDGGVGEQDDLSAAILYLADQGIEEIHLAGYSFGSWVIAGMDALAPQVTALLFVSPPAAFIPFPENLQLPLLELVVTGENDEFAPPALLEKQIYRWNENVSLKVVDYADHFYYGSFPELEALVGKWLGSRE